MSYVVEDFGNEEYLDGILCRYLIKNNTSECDYLCYIFDKEMADIIVDHLNSK